MNTGITNLPLQEREDGHPYEDQKIKLALITSGAVSLGSYQAGVIYELFSLLEKFGKKTTYEIDVITGASAGAVNSVIFALAMMYDPDIIHYVKEIWIENLDLSVLLEKVEHPENSLLSHRVIKQMKTELLSKVKKSQNKELPFFPKKVKVALTLSNLSGIPYSIFFKNKKEGFPLTTFADWFILELQQGNKDPKVIQSIEQMIDIAIASGAFPFAFPAQSIKRDWKDYQHTAIKETPSGELEFIYVDGGVFNNEPINRAKELADDLDDERTKRIYFLIDPSPPTPEQDFQKRDMLSVGKRLIPAIFAEAHFRDWHYAVKINQRLEWQQKLIKEFQERIKDLGSKEGLVINNAWMTMRDEIVDFKTKRSDINKAKYWKENKQRIHSMLKNTSALVSDSDYSQQDDMLTNFIFVLENIAGLRGKKPLDIRLLAPENKQVLAGAFFIHFGGFFSKEYREHDFFIGRDVARKFVSNPETVGGLGIDLSIYPLEKIKDPLNVKNATIQDAPDESKIKLRDNLVERVDTLLNNLLVKHGVGVFNRLKITFAVAFFPWRITLRKYVKSALKNLLNEKLEIKRKEKQSDD